MIYLMILLWAGSILSIFLIQRDRKRTGERMRVRIEELEHEIRILRQADPVGVKMRRMNNAAAALLEAIQEKENDIAELLERVGETARGGNPVAAAGDMSGTGGASNGMSYTERHMIERLRGREG